MNEQQYLAKIANHAENPRRAVIREADCIGCTKCIQACPVDAIVGAAKQMHTVIMTECTGCQLCVEPCPVDCIEMMPVAEPLYDTKQMSVRFNARIARLNDQKIILPASDLDAKRAYILAATQRVRAKRRV